MARFELNSIPAAKAAVKTARKVMVQIRFGCSENWVKISKVEALEFLELIGDNTTAREMEMGTGNFGEWNNHIVYLG